MLSCVQFFSALGFGRFSVLAELVTVAGAAGIGLWATHRHRPSPVVAEAEAITEEAARTATRTHA